MNRISPPAPTRAALRAALSLLFTLALLIPGLAAPAAAAGQRAKASPKKRAGVSKTRTTARRKPASGRDSAARPARNTRPAALLQAPRQEQEAEADDAEKRDNWFYYERAYPFGEIPANARRRAWESRPGIEKGDDRVRALSQNGIWTPIGPAPTEGVAPANWGPTSGRINAIAVHPTNPAVILVGASTGGIWRSTDGGANFAPVSDTQVDLAVGAIAFAPSNPNVVYAGMGDLDNTYVGTGVLKSTDAGATWTRVNDVSFPAQGFVTDILVDPANPDRVYAAQDLSLNPNGIPQGGYAFFTSGVRVSNDGGVSWQRTLPGRARNLALHPTNPQIIYAAMRSVDGNGGPPGVYKSTNAGATWANIYATPFINPSVPTALVTRDMQVAVTPAAPENVYVYIGRTSRLTQDPNEPLRELHIEVSTNGGANWSSRGAGGTTNIDTGQFGYNTYIKVSPANAAVIYIGGRDIFKTTNGDSATPVWSNRTRNFHNPPNFATYNPFQSNTHPDQHTLTFDPTNPNVLYAGNDGGISKSVDGGTNFTSLNQTLSLTQFVHLSLHPTDGAVSIGGSQDNGTQLRLNGSNNWREVSSGDGGKSLFNPADASMAFTTYVFGRVNRFVNSGLTFNGTIANSSTFGESEATPRIAFYAPLVGNGVNSRLYFGTWQLFVCDDCNDTSKRIGNGLTAPTWTPTAPNIDLTRGGGDVLETIAVSRADTNYIYTGSRQGCARVSKDGGATWTPSASGECLTGLPNRVIKSITVDPTNRDIAYLTVSGYGSGHVFKTTNAGSTWTDISNNLPNVPVNAFLIDPLNATTFYVGTDIGVFRSLNAGASWETFNTGMPPVVVTAFAAQASGRIQAATYGRGAYELAVVADPTVQFNSAGVTVSEVAGQAVITVTRGGNAQVAGSVVVSTVDDPEAVRCDVANGKAYARCDYATTVETLNFAAGQMSKTFAIPLINDGHSETNETLQIALSSPVNFALGGQATMTLTLTSDDAPNAPNPLDFTTFFVRQQYLDFLSREPEPSEPWTGVLLRCPNQFNRDKNNPSKSCDRNHVSSAFFRSPEFELKGFYVFRFYVATLGRLPTYDEIAPDMRRVTGSTGAETLQKRAQFAEAWLARPGFAAEYAALSNVDFVVKLLGRYNQPGGLQSVFTPNPLTPDDQNSKITITRQQLVDRLNAETYTRAQVVRAVADSDEVNAAEFERAFVAMQYYGYLRRTPDQDGFNAWLRHLRANPGDYYTMVNGFASSTEYRLRFGKE